MVDYRFTRNHRLLTSADYKSVFDNPDHKVSCRYILMLAIKQKRCRARLGMVVSKKNIPKSVERNRIKRLIRESFRNAESQLPKLDVVVLIRKGMMGLPNLVISSRIDALWKDLRIKTDQQQATNTSRKQGM